MAITSTITIKMAEADLPVGYNPPVISALSAGYKSEPFEIQVASSGVANANPVTGVTQLVAAVKTEIDSNYIEPELGLDPTETIAVRIYITDVERGFSSFDAKDKQDQYLTGTDVFKVKGIINWKL